MQRVTFLLRVTSWPAFRSVLRSQEAPLRAFLDGKGISNASLWGIDDLAFGYAEWDGSRYVTLPFSIENAFGTCSEWIARPGEMRLMYEDIGVVHTDKSEIRHRVFATLIHKGCANEYKARHDALTASRAGQDPVDHEDSNFTIWCTEGKYNFGYCEKVIAFDHEETPEEHAQTVAWETKMLEIMDWLTDDVDWLTGQHHDKIACLFRQ